MYQVKELTTLLCMGRCKSLGSLKINPLICTNSFLRSIYCVFTSWVYSELTLGSACSPMTGILFSPEFLRLTDSCWRVAILDDYDIHCLLIWKEIFCFWLKTLQTSYPSLYFIQYHYLLSIIKDLWEFVYSVSLPLFTWPFHSNPSELTFNVSTPEKTSLTILFKQVSPLSLRMSWPFLHT